MARAVNILINGATQLNSRLERIKNVNPALISAINKATVLVSGRAKYRCPVDTGALRNSIHTHPADADGNTVKGVVYTAKEYAPYVEFGTGRRGSYPYKTKIALAYSSSAAGQVAQPFLMPALLESKSNIQEMISKAVIKAAIANAKG